MKENIKALNGLKIPFAILIILTHYQGNLCWAQSPIACLKFFFDYGSLGVEFFFILSGFLIAYNYKDRIRDMGIEQFWGGRMRKLLPYFVFGVAIDIVLYLLDQYILKINVAFQYNTIKLNLFSIITSLIVPLRAGINTDVFGGVLWFMGDLSILYASYWLISKIERNFRGVYIISVSIIAVVCLDGMNREADYFILSNHIMRSFSCFSVGVLLYEFLNAIKSENTKKILGHIMLISVVLLSIFVIVFDAETILGVDRLRVRMAFIIYIIPAMIVSVIYVTWLNKLMSMKWIQIMASFTTALYVTHADIIHLCHILASYFKLQVSYLDAGVFVIIFILCLAFAVPTEYFIRFCKRKMKL